MLKQTVTAGVLLLAGAPVLMAGQPLIPPVPSTNGGESPAVQTPVPPPLPGLNTESVIPKHPSSTSQSIPAAPPAASDDPLPPPVSAPAATSPHAAPSGQTTPGVHGSMIYPEAVPHHEGHYGAPAYGMQGYDGYPREIPPYNSFSLGSQDRLWFQSGPPGGEHARYPYYSYRRPWYAPGPASRNVNIVW